MGRSFQAVLLRQYHRTAGGQGGLHRAGARRQDLGRVQRELMRRGEVPPSVGELTQAEGLLSQIVDASFEPGQRIEAVRLLASESGVGHRHAGASASLPRPFPSTARLSTRSAAWNGASDKAGAVSAHVRSCGRALVRSCGRAVRGRARHSHRIPEREDPLFPNAYRTFQNWASSLSGARRAPAGFLASPASRMAADSNPPPLAVDGRPKTCSTPTSPRKTTT
jgi:hypothetical protein